MVFSRFFKDKSAPPPEETEEETEAETETEAPADDDEPEEGNPEEWIDPSFAERATKILATGSSTGSKRPAALYGDIELDDEPIGPTHFARAHGCHVDTLDGTTLVDCTMALGAVSIGYAHPDITRAALEAIGGGNASGLPSYLEVEVAERFCELVPCAEKAHFLKTGAEAVAAAVRIARTYTNRDVVIGSGYFGWHDWCSDAPGVPAAIKQLYKSVPFDDVAALDAAVSQVGDRLAAIVIEPVVERLPSTEWIARARELCDQKGAVLIFDEIKTGFRIATGGYQDTTEVKPDLAAFGKALANGFPLSAVCGRADLMDAVQRTWISSTLASESGALAAAFVVLDMYREGGVCEKLAKAGSEMRKVVDEAIESSGIGGVTTAGIDPMWLVRFESPEVEARFIRAAVRHGALFKRGAYNFASLAHDEEAIHEIESAASNALVEVRRTMESE